MPYLKLFAVAALLGLIWGLLLEPIVKNLEDAEEVMCGGQLNFLFAELEAGPVVAGIPTNPRKLDPTAYSYRAVLQRTGLNVDESKHFNETELWYLDSDATPALFPIEDVQAAQRYDALTIADLARANQFLPYAVGCGIYADKFWSRSTTVQGTTNAIQKAIAHVTGVANHTCQYLKDLGLCNENTHAGSVQRFFCPHTCGMGDPTSGLAYAQPAQGVPLHCAAEIGLSLRTLPCENLPTAHPAFRVYANSLQKANEFNQLFRRLSQGNMTHLNITDQLLFGDIAIHGCGYAEMPLRFLINLFDRTKFAVNQLWCDPIKWKNAEGALRSLRYLCPVSCGCSTTVKEKYTLDGKPWSQTIGIEENCAKACFD